ncbi:uncharacterized protein Triagg1_4607 [Trichoderma aggressivum f. europaeum]|uniref:Molybdopterin synthase sulfur carrier subunit n=1 Tax=Trichoderma aggressivum f. europaeum TaxID=173218 RepID=A0AAE1IGX5_9HYPO|nr:hypothetical protein Triagg1_4607 [Trichoderma aggressivum f. europaeum]
MTSSAPKPPRGHFSVLYFAGAGSFTGRDSESLPAPLPLGKLFSELESRYPGVQAKILDSCLVTVNLDYVDVPEAGEDGALIQEGDEVAIIPPLHTFCSDLRILPTVTTAAATINTAANVAKTATTTASAVPDETLHPRGLVLTSHRSSGCGQILPAKAGASAGMVYSFGTHDHVCIDKASIFRCQKR